MKLHQAFDITRGDVVAFVGAGGKTSTMIGLGYELIDMGWRVLVTTTISMDKSQLDLMPFAVRFTGHSNSFDEISSALNSHKLVFLYGDIQNGNVHGLPLDSIRKLLDAVDSDVLLIEADSALGMPLKAPYLHEPIIPLETSLVIPIVSLAILGKIFDETHVYNPQAMTAKYGFFPGTRVKSPWIAQVLRDEEMGLRGAPLSARVVAFLNQTPAHGYLRGRARMIARLALQSPRIQGVALGSVRAAEPVHELQRAIGAVVLAAGLSSRMGQTKVLLPWADGKTIIENIIEQLIKSRVDSIVVVTGHQGDEVKSLVKPLGVKVVHNRAYKKGEMLSSLQTGLKAMPNHISAALVVLGDQPRLQPKVIYQVLNAYAEGKGTIIAPSYEMRRGHPILIARKFWQEILNLHAGGAPRDVINAHPDQIAHVEVNTDSVLRDVDTPEEYQQERLRAGLINAPRQTP